MGAPHRLRVILEKGFFPKELPPGFTTADFAAYANKKAFKQKLDLAITAMSSKKQAPWQLHSAPVTHNFPISQFGSRKLSIVNPIGYAVLARLVCKNWRELVKLAASKISVSRPVYSINRSRAISPSTYQEGVKQRKFDIRSGRSYLVQCDVSAFYDTLYTHAISWAITPSSKGKNDKKSLGGQIDNAVRNLKERQTIGIPIGPDISLLLAEIVMKNVDDGLQSDQALRWYDDFEIAVDTIKKAEELLAGLTRRLRYFRLNVNAAKSSISSIPQPIETTWKRCLNDISLRPGDTSDSDLIGFFDVVFHMRAQNPDKPVLNYALGKLFSLLEAKNLFPRMVVGVSQCILAEPGCTHKAVALLMGLKHNGGSLNSGLLKRTFEALINHTGRRTSAGDITWALHACIELGIHLSDRAARTIKDTQDDVALILALDMIARGLLKDLGIKKMCEDWMISKTTVWDDEHWLVLYEGVRHSWLTDKNDWIKSDSAFGEMLRKDVRFYDSSNLTPMATLMHPIGAPGWWKITMRNTALKALKDAEEQKVEIPESVRPVAEAIKQSKTPSEFVRLLLGIRFREDDEDEGYPSE